MMNRSDVFKEIEININAFIRKNKISNILNQTNNSGVIKIYSNIFICVFFSDLSDFQFEKTYGSGDDIKIGVDYIIGELIHKNYKIEIIVLPYLMYDDKRYWIGLDKETATEYQISYDGDISLLI